MKEQPVMGGRFLGIDIVRTIAIFSVIAGHFWVLNTPYRKVDFDGSFSMFVQGMGYFFFEIGVPLFLLMTGYLNYKKYLSIKIFEGNTKGNLFLPFLFCPDISL